MDSKPGLGFGGKMLILLGLLLITLHLFLFVLIWRTDGIRKAGERFASDFFNIAILLVFVVGLATIASVLMKWLRSRGSQLDPASGDLEREHRKSA